MKPFAPNAPTITLSATTTSSENTTLPADCAQIRVHNAGPNVAFMRWGNVALTAVTTDMPIAVGATEVFTKGSNKRIAAICGTGTATIYVTPGEGE